MIELFFSVSFWVATLRIATPLIFGTLGELLCERAGVLNLGIEGIMTMGAMVGWLSVYQGAGLWGGVVAAAVAGAVAGFLHSALTVRLGLSQHVTGIGITLLSTNLAYFGYRMVLPEVSSPPKIIPFGDYPLPGLSKIPVLGEILFQQPPLTYGAVCLVVAVGYGLYHTPLGLAVRMVGENPQAAEAQGIPVYGVRSGAVVVGSALMGVAGAFLTLSAFDAFFFNIVNGRGWICIALVVFASWQPYKALAGALLFAGFDALQLRLQQIWGGGIPYQFFLMLPYLLSIVALVLVSRQSRSPQALLLPFRKGERT
ncbi:MAG: ABC transporter permease [Cyanobacteriota bacterium]|nr:ABC transporter permease [Cyanobacteriota bacterium]